MYINKIHIQNYRNYNDFSMNFHKGLNVIIGSNNSGKTGLLYAIICSNIPLLYLLMILTKTICSNILNCMLITLQKLLLNITSVIESQKMILTMKV